MRVDPKVEAAVLASAALALPSTYDVGAQFGKDWLLARSYNASGHRVPCPKCARPVISLSIGAPGRDHYANHPGQAGCLLAEAPWRALALDVPR